VTVTTRRRIDAHKTDAESVEVSVVSDEQTDANADLPAGVTIETATSDDTLDVVRVLDAAMLQTDLGDLTARITDGAVECARFGRTGAVIGAVVTRRRDGETLHIDALAVRRTRRGNGIGSALVRRVLAVGTADEAVSWVTAGFDPDLEPFYRACGFVTATSDDGRCVGRRRVAADGRA
jgi:ribosomal protein S18 acetylase RimI-like enzyme